jgi:hypothetical protein
MCVGETYEGSDEGRGEMENQLKRVRWRKARGGGKKSRSRGMEWRVRGGRENVGGRCYLRQRPLLFLRHPKLAAAGLAPGYSPVYTAPTLLLDAWRLIYVHFDSW